ncbi:hypothetical protein E3Q22_02750 [Wallemia mellicola]|uniref:SWR1-complex protein 4 n=2 Tax=Wallemia mellicola TaxID=1708541 RepID=A0A4T0N6U1_9BASI|nr:hypothetical protein WALSEDRAFT_55803 [Wallemia mellicola CBS 633.66]TIB71248.1 hypothetical protein E3Q24_02414 [Wallemia mellicola]EIM23861.1 hypothetical protein WALSEDRAFT_55803 [Wallemia mellicola CBS 633.66]TIB73833.1 hypothetical protein E3Q23_02869 [Wallemia mellicola]TIB78117.1 hypothetical protein E3Q22_02750 [Wallemia mellicola]TIB83594.1 hypothetical protein E3Q21_02814 [Wallemia mellicola]|eukprot:XP_006955705.1 hypothetical protein WALSEDRAFT_55803 [Wallemia mellicola CBS 633.66]
MSEEVPKELESMMGESLLSVITANNPLNQGKDFRVRKWRQSEISNPGRSDDLKASIWKRSDEDDDQVFSFSEYNTSSQAYSYSQDEYDRMLQDITWSKDETDYLVNLIHEFDVRWPVIWDRYEWRSGRTLEDLKARYFDICRKLIQSRISTDESSTNQLLSAYQFDKGMFARYLGDPVNLLVEREMLRKQYLNSLLTRTPQQVEDEELLYIEAKRIEQNERKWRSERDELFRTVSMSSRDEKRKADAAITGASEENITKRTAKNTAFDDQNYITHTSSQLPLKTSSSNIPPYSRATKVSQKITLQRIKESLNEMGLADKLQYPTANNVTRYESVKEAMSQLLEIRKAHEKVASDLNIAKGITPPNVASSPAPAQAPERSMSVDSNDPNKKRKL